MGGLLALAVFLLAVLTGCELLAEAWAQPETQDAARDAVSGAVGSAVRGDWPGIAMEALKFLGTYIASVITVDRVRERRRRKRGEPTGKPST